MPKHKTPYWWNARHAQRAVPEKRVIVFAKPEATIDAIAVNNMNSGSSGSWEIACDCGYVICSKSGPCAPDASAPVAPEPVVVEPAPSPEAGEQRCSFVDRMAKALSEWAPPGWSLRRNILRHPSGGEVYPESSGAFWFDGGNEDNGLKRPTLAQACCAALSITLHREPESGQVYAYEGPMRVRAACLCVVRGDLEAGARAALIAFHEKGGA